MIATYQQITKRQSTVPCLIAILLFPGIISGSTRRSKGELSWIHYLQNGTFLRFVAIYLNGFQVKISKIPHKHG